eukprot:gene15897-9904_t
MVKLGKKERKQKYFETLEKYNDQFNKVLIVGVDNIRSKQMQNVRHALRNRCELLMGKNTLMRKCLRDMAEARGEEIYTEMLDHVKGNIGFCFTDMDAADVRDVFAEFKIQAPAKAGIFAPVDVMIPDGPTGMGPEKTSFFQALNLPTKIVRGVISILNETKVVSAGEKVGLSEAKLLNMLNISPFFYGIELLQIVEAGSIYPPSVLEITTDVLLAKFASGASRVAAISLQIGYPTKASVPHLLVNGFKNVIAVALATDITFEHAGLENAKLFLSDPEAWASANPGGGGGGGGGDAAAAPAAAAAAPAAAAPAASESEEDMDMGLFD